MLIATQQPMASDLRVLSAILNIITDLERMCDHAAGIGKITLLVSYRTQYILSIGDEYWCMCLMGVDLLNVRITLIEASL